MLSWVKFPEELQSSISELIFSIELFFKFFLEEKVNPSDNQKLKDSFTDFFNHLNDACLIYENTAKDTEILEKLMNALNEKEFESEESKKIFNIMEEIFIDLNITYLNICLLISNQAFTFKPNLDLSIDEIIKELDDTRDKFIPLVRSMAIERTHFDKYLLELTYLDQKLYVD